MKITIESEAGDPMQMKTVVITEVQSAVVGAFVDPVMEDDDIVGGTMRVCTVGYEELMPSVVSSLLMSCRERFGDDFFDKVGRATARNTHGPEEPLQSDAQVVDAPRRRRVGPVIQ